MSIQDARRLYEAMANAFEVKDWDRVCSFFADDAVVEFPEGSSLGGVWQGAGRIREFYQHVAEYVASEIPEVTVRVDTVLRGPGGEYAIIWQQRSRLDQPEWPGLTVIQMSDGKVSYLKDFMPY